MNLFLVICNLLASNLNWIIIVLGCSDVILMSLFIWRLSKSKRAIKRLMQGEKQKVGKARKTGRGKVEKQFVETVGKDWEAFDAFRNEYQNRMIRYSFTALAIQIFPLLGILGTVAGLYIAVSQGQDIYSGVSFALSSTILGIMFAVFLKILEIFGTAVFVNYIDDCIDRFEKGYSIDNEEAKVAMIAVETEEK